MSESVTIRPHGALRRRDLPTITGPMAAVLVRLRSAQQDGAPFVELLDVDSRTVRALEERDWIVSASSRRGRVDYKITGRGLHALKVYEPIVKRNDGLCPRCCERPRTLYSSGKPTAYCRECTRLLGQRTYRLGLYRLRPQGLCARCEKHPRFVASSGKTYSYCKHCKNLMRRHEHERQRKDLLKKVLAGEHVACRRDGCEQPRYVSGKSVQDYCYQHYREYQNGYYHQVIKPSQEAANAQLALPGFGVGGAA